MRQRARPARKIEPLLPASRPRPPILAPIPSADTSQAHARTSPSFNPVYIRILLFIIIRACERAPEERNYPRRRLCRFSLGPLWPARIGPTPSLPAPF